MALACSVMMQTGFNPETSKVFCRNSHLKELVRTFWRRLPWPTLRTSQTAGSRAFIGLSTEASTNLADPRDSWVRGDGDEVGRQVNEHKTRVVMLNSACTSEGKGDPMAEPQQSRPTSCEKLGPRQSIP